MSGKLQLTEQSVRQAIRASGANSFTTLYRALGHKAKPNSKATAAIKALVPEVEALLKANKTAKAAKPAKHKGRLTFPRHPANPFRPNPKGGYSLVFDVLAAHPDGIAREKLQELYRKAGRGVSQDKARFDVAVVLSVKGEGLDSERHTSCRSGFGIRRDGAWVQLVLPK